MKNEYPFIELPKEYFKLKFGDEWKHEIEEPDEVSYSTIKVDRSEFPIFKKHIVSANFLEVTAGTTGYEGGDSGHGGRTYIRIEDASCTDIRVKPIENSGNGGVEIILGGDCELSTIIRGLDFIVNVLRCSRYNGTLYEGQEPID